MSIDSSPKSDTGPILSPKEQVLAAERAFMRAQSKYVNKFDPSEQDSNDLDATSKKVNELYERYPEHKPVPKVDPAIEAASTHE